MVTKVRLLGAIPALKGGALRPSLFGGLLELTKSADFGSSKTAVLQQQTSC